MLGKARQQKYFLKYLSALNFHINTFMKTQNAESLHKFRIEVKRIKALISINESAKKKIESLALPLRTQKAYRLCGEIRQIDIYIRQLKKFQLLDPALSIEYNKLRKEKILKLKLFLGKHAEKITGTDRELSKHLNKISNETITSKTKNKLNKINNILKFKYKDPEQLHTARKHMKQLIYIHKIIPRKSKIKLHLNINYLNSLQDLIGKWHDLYEAGIEYSEKAGNKIESIIILKKAQQTQLKQLRHHFRKFDKKVNL